MPTPVRLAGRVPRLVLGAYPVALGLRISPCTAVTAACGRQAFITASSVRCKPQRSKPSSPPHLPATTSRPPASQAHVPKPAGTNDSVLHEDIYTIPNFLTFTRLVAAPVVGYLVLHDQHAWAVGLFAYAGVTDLLDGWIARRWNRKTVVGTIIDPMADKALMTILTVCLAVKGALPCAFAPTSPPPFPPFPYPPSPDDIDDYYDDHVLTEAVRLAVWVATIILGRDVGLGFAAIYYRWISLPPPKTFTRYWDFSLPSAEVRPTTISKYNTFLQLALVGLTTSAPLIGADLGLALSTLQYVVAGTTVWSGASYVYSKDAVKILNKAKPHGKQE